MMERWDRFLDDCMSHFDGVAGFVALFALVVIPVVLLVGGTAQIIVWLFA